MNINLNKESKKSFELGSKYFFNSYKDYVQKDTDTLLIIPKLNELFPRLEGSSYLLKLGKDDLIMYKDFSKEEFISYDVSSNDPIKVGKYLIPEFIEYLKMTIDDLKRIKPLIDKLDDKHKYEEIIYNAYISNNDFTLTEEQKLEAYKLYKEQRKELYNN